MGVYDAFVFNRRHAFGSAASTLLVHKLSVLLSNGIPPGTVLELYSQGNRLTHVLHTLHSTKCVLPTSLYLHYMILRG